MTESTISDVGSDAAATSEVAAPARNTEDGTVDKKGKRERVKKVRYRAEDAPKLTEWPEGFDKKLHKPLRRSDFANELVWLKRKYNDAVERAKSLKQEVDDYEKYGDPKARKQAHKAQAMMKQAAELLKNLKAEGNDVGDMEAQFKALFAAQG